VLASGGLDSAVLLGTLARRHTVHPLYVRCGLAWERAEQRLLARFLAALRARHGRRVAPLARLDLPVASLYGAAHWSVSGRGVPGRRAAVSSNYLPGRNLLLGGLGAVHCARYRIPALALALSPTTLSPTRRRRSWPTSAGWRAGGSGRASGSALPSVTWERPP